MSSSNIKVVVRTRPLDESKKEKWAPGFEVRGRRIILGAKTFDPDVTTDPSASQEDVYAACTPIIDSVKDGSNGTIMVYGQTGTGKTHTMLGSANRDGVAFRAIHDLISYVRQQSLNGRRMVLTMSMLEIYNEKITDMLSEALPEVTLINGYPHQVTKICLSSIDDAHRIVQQGLECRRVAPTAMNERSSRSHVLVMLDVEEINEDGSADIAHLFLVDLAGSESIKKSNVTGKAASEAGMINKSLLALKTVILALSSSDSNKPGHVPYRDSKLTQILQDSIGGTARTMLIACVSPIGRDLEETKSTLEYACKARSIRNVANTERDKMTQKLRNMEVELQRLRNKLEDRLNERNGCYVSKAEYDRMEAVEAENGQLKDEIQALTKLVESAQAGKHVMEGQLQLFTDMVKEADAKTDRYKEAYETAMVRVEHVQQQTTKMCIEASEAVGAAWQEEAQQRASKTHSVSEVIRSGDLLKDFSPHMEEICANIHDNCRTLLGKFQDLHSSMAKELNAVDEAESRANAIFSEELQAAISAATTKHMRALHSLHEDRQRVVRNAGELVDLNVERAPSVSSLHGFTSLLDALQGDLDTATKPLQYECSVPESVANSMTNLREKIRTASHTVAAESMIPAPASAVAARSSQRRASQGHPPQQTPRVSQPHASPASTVASAGLPPMPDKENVGTKRKARPTNSIGLHDELMKRRTRRESGRSTSQQMTN